tara:strand:+ start:1488 stop:2459 length:972 start_codon:yes stop_codon:yes gene_type:complete
MHISFLNIICDPFTGEDLELEVIKQNGEFIIDGYLKNQNSHYKIISGIPRFINKNDLKDSFNFQWKKWNKLQFEDKNIGLPMEGHTKKMFYSITDFKDEMNKDKVFLDIGAGSGRFADVLIANGSKVVCIEVSNSVDQIYKNLSKNRKNALIIQCDFEKLPIKNSSIDHAFSIGVLHHSKKPEAAFPETYRVLKKEGSFAVSVYSKNSPYNFINIYVWRKFFNFLKIPFSFYPILIYTYFFVNIYYLIAKILKFKYLNIFQLSIFPCFIYRDKNWSLLDTFDSLSPEFASTHSNQEVYNWFADNKFKEISKIGPYDSNFKGFK